ncbi:hypothetical protein OF83DRAFT_628239 [Amylostereum chailletii]|nr:hypothetical protein OF83DRAFT_628239 [Amylostereum chailletii]
MYPVFASICRSVHKSRRSGTLSRPITIVCSVLSIKSRAIQTMKRLADENLWAGTTSKLKKDNVWMNDQDIANEIPRTLLHASPRGSARVEEATCRVVEKLVAVVRSCERLPRPHTQASSPLSREGQCRQTALARDALSYYYVLRAFPQPYPSLRDVHIFQDSPLWVAADELARDLKDNSSFMDVEDLRPRRRPAGYISAHHEDGPRPQDGILSRPKLGRGGRVYICSGRPSIDRSLGEPTIGEILFDMYLVWTLSIDLHSVHEINSEGQHPPHARLNFPNDDRLPSGSEHSTFSSFEQIMSGPCILLVQPPAAIGVV